MEGYVYAYNPTDEDCIGSCWFRHTEYDANGFPTGWKREHTGPTETLGPRSTYGPHYTDSCILNYRVGGDIELDQTIYLNAHIHLQVSGNNTTDVWHDNSWTHTFDYWDNQ